MKITLNKSFLGTISISERLAECEKWITWPGLSNMFQSLQTMTEVVMICIYDLPGTEQIQQYFVDIQSVLQPGQR